MHLLVYELYNFVIIGIVVCFMYMCVVLLPWLLILMV